jgi:transcriptional regulator with XRE-family HTH domain
MALRKSHDTRRILADNVCRLRAEHGDMSQDELARAARLTQTQVSKIENSKVSTGVDILQRIARVFGTTPAALLEEKTPPEGSG